MSDEKTMNIHERLMHIQCELNAPKTLYNEFGKYSYRSAESILEAVKPFLSKYRCTLTFDDNVFEVADRIYVQAVAILTNVDNPEETVMKASPAREADSKKGMDAAQVTGATLSYARKYALGALLALDDNKDVDTNEYHGESEARSKSAPQEQQEPITMKALEQLESLAQEAGITIEQICSTFKLGSLQDMTMPQWLHAVKMLENEMKKKGAQA